MNKKIRKEIAEYYVKIDTIIMAVFSIVALWFKPLIGVVCILITAGTFAFHKYVSEKNLQKILNKYKESVLSERNDLLETLSNGSPLLVCMIDRNLDIQWSNPAFDFTFESNEQFIEEVGREELKSFFEDVNTYRDFNIGDKVFRVNASSLLSDSGKYRVLFWEDISESYSNKAKYEDSRMCFAYASVDNFDEILQDTAIEKRSLVEAQIDRVVFEFAKELEAAIYRAEDGRYCLAFRKKYLESMKEANFPVLEKMHEIESGADYPVSLSIGIGHGYESLNEIQNVALEAIDLALGRGGDQAVIRSKDADTEYFGGVLPSVEKRNKGKSKVRAHALMNLINDADKVVIMGHTRPDMDAIGSAFGICALANNMGKKSYIVLENPGEAVSLACETALTEKREDGKNAYNFVSHSAGRELIDSKTLLVILDHHRAAISEDPEIVKIADRIAIIDHHRRSTDAIEKPLLSFMEPYASSASELVTEILQYCGDMGEITKFEAEALLAGISLDTKNFTTSSGVRTFEAAAYLKRNGADVNNIKKYFKMDLKLYQKKLNVIANAEILENGIAVAYTKQTDPAMQLIVSMAADELLSMKGVEAAIAAGGNGECTMMSARSNGKYNVQTLLEKLGGGGHQLAAAVQLDLGPEESIALAVKEMRSEGIL